MADDRCVPLQGASPRGGSGRWKPGHGTYKRGLNTKIHLAVDANGMPVRVLVTADTRADCKEAIALIDGIAAQYLLADRGYDTNELIRHALANEIQPVIPSKKTGLNRELTILICTNCDILSKMHLCISNVGAVLPRDTPKPRTLLSLQFISVVSCCGAQFWLDSCQHYIEENQYKELF